MGNFYNPMGPNGFWNSVNNYTIPIEFDESLSFSQQIGNLRYVIENMQKLVTQILESDSEYREEVKVLTNKIDALTANGNLYAAEIAALRERLSDLENEHREDMLRLSGDMTNLFTELAQRINSNKSDIAEAFQDIQETNRAVNGLKAQYNTDFAKLRSELFELLETFEDVFHEYIKWQLAVSTGNSILVHNPVTQTLSSLNKALSDLWISIIETFAIQKREYDALNITKAEYDAKNIQKYQYDTQAKLILMPELVFHWFDEKIKAFTDEVIDIRDFIAEHLVRRNPLTGKEDFVDNIATQTAEYLTLGFTAKAYNKAGLTKSQYDGTQMTMEEYRLTGYLKAFLRLMTLEGFGNEKPEIFTTGDAEKMHITLQTRGELSQNRKIVFPDHFDAKLVEFSNYVAFNEIQETCWCNFNGYRTLNCTYNFKYNEEDGTYTYYPEALNLINLHFMRRENIV